MKMKPLKQWKIWQMVALAAAAAVILLLLIFSLVGNLLLRQGIETVGSQLLGTRVTVGRVIFAPLSGHFSIRDLRVANPSNCAEPDALRFQKVSVTVNIWTLLKEELIIKEITVTGFSIHFEPSLDGSSNLGTLQKNLKRFTGSGSKESSSSQKDTGSNRKVVISHLAVTDTSVRVTAFRQTLTLPLPDVVMDDIGKGSSVAETIDGLFSQMMLNVSSVWQKSSEMEKYRKELNEAGQKAVDAVKKNSRELEKKFRQYLP